ncbi:MAG: 6-carboxytetrahydropterin synthase [Polyangiales bacterium]
MYTIRRSIDVSFAHQCARAARRVHHPRAHAVRGGARCPTLDREGFVVDFGRLKAEVLEPVHRLLDHALAVGAATYDDVAGELVPVGEKLLASRAEVHGAQTGVTAPASLELAGARTQYPGGMKVVVFPFDPTSERLAEWLYRLAESTLANDRVNVAIARVFETLHPVESVATFSKS